MDAPHDQVKPLSEKTKWIIAFSFLLIFIILQFVIFNMGYNRGWGEGSEVPPLRIIEQSDEKAMATLANFMAESASGPEALARLLQNRESELAWIRDESLRRDVTWGLARELLVEGGNGDALNIIRELIEQGYAKGETGKWASRSELVGKILFSRDDMAKASFYFHKAAEGYSKDKQTKQEIKVLDGLVSCMIATNRMDDVMTVLAKLNELTINDPLDRSRILATMGRIARLQGKSADSRKYFKTAMELWPEGGTSGEDENLGSARICLAEALLESGRTDEAEKLFRSGLAVLRGKDSELSFTTSALRGLAQIASGKQKYQEALAWLYQAEGAAKGRLPQHDTFWPCLYDQRGWVLLNKADRVEAVKDFLKAVDATAAPDAQAQACEGLGMAYLELGKEKQAHQYLAKAIELRLKLFPDDLLSLGRVYKNLGMANDLLGQNEDALDCYGKSIDALQKSGNAGKSPLYIETLLCKCHTLCELSRWQEAVDAFNVVIPLLEGEPKVETLKQLATCYDNLNMRDKGDECWREAGYPRVISSKKSRR